MAETPESTEPAEDQDDVRARFREALERKNHQAQAGAAHRDSASKVHEAHGPAAAKRSFRRKSG